MCTMDQCQNNVGNWVQFRTPWGAHRGMIQSVNSRGVLMKVPGQYAPVGLATYQGATNASDEEKLDIALAYGGYPGYGAPGGYGPRPGYPGYGVRPGYPGHGYWARGWWWWWLAFA